MHEERREKARRDLHLTDSEEQSAVEKAVAADADRHERTVARREEQVMTSKNYRVILWADKYMDKYGLDAVLSLIPYVGDAIGFLFVIPGLRISIGRLHSLPLTMAILYDFLVDAVLGLIPVVGPVLDFFFKANSRVAKLVRGYVEDDGETMREVHRKATYFIVASIVLIALIVLMIYFFVEMWEWVIGLVRGPSA
jgi:hypothetical protein